MHEKENHDSEEVVFPYDVGWGAPVQMNDGQHGSDYSIRRVDMTGMVNQTESDDSGFRHHNLAPMSVLHASSAGPMAPYPNQSKTSEQEHTLDTTLDESGHSQRDRANTRDRACCMISGPCLWVTALVLLLMGAVFAAGISGWAIRRNDS